MHRFSRSHIYQAIEATRLVPVLYSPSLAEAVGLLRAAAQAGIRAFEYTNRGPEAFSVFQELVRVARAECPDMALGIGTVMDAPTAAAYLLAGADFVVSPLFSAEIALLCNRRKVAWVPGAATLTEISAAEAYGAEVVKVFPASTLGPAFVKSVLGPSPWSRLMVTGGLKPTAESLRPWLDAGAVAVGMGEALLGTPPAIDPEQLTEHFRQALALTALRPTP